MDRDLQREVLNMLSESYPAWKDTNPLRKEEPQVVQALAYLEEHGLTEVKWTSPIGGASHPFLAKITARGLDFLSDDGGLSAILGVVTIKLHDDTIRQLMLSKIESAPDIGTEERSRLAKAVRDLPSKLIEKLADKLLELGADSMVRGSPQLGMWIDHALNTLL